MCYIPHICSGHLTLNASGVCTCVSAVMCVRACVRACARVCVSALMCACVCFSFSVCVCVCLECVLVCVLKSREQEEIVMYDRALVV